MITRNIGDQNEVACPACGRPIRDLWDLGDGLCDGETVDCGYCGETVNIESVETEVTVTLTYERVEKGGAE